MYEGGGIDLGLSGLLDVSSLSVNGIKGLSYLV
jgi:hypothetical protein